MHILNFAALFNSFHSRNCYRLIPPESGRRFDHKRPRFFHAITAADRRAMQYSKPSRPVQKPEKSLPQLLPRRVPHLGQQRQRHSGLRIRPRTQHSGESSGIVLRFVRWLMSALRERDVGHVAECRQRGNPPELCGFTGDRRETVGAAKRVAVEWVCAARMGPESGAGSHRKRVGFAAVAGAGYCVEEIPHALPLAWGRFLVSGDA